MAKNRINDFSTTAASNTDIAGVGILGTNKPANLDDAIRALMALLADWREGTSLNATANFNDPTDTTKVFALSGANIPTATTRSIDAEALYDLASDADDIIAQKRNVISGMTLSNAADATNDITTAVGFCSDSTNAGMLVLASAITKQLDVAWAVGTNQGGLDTGAVANGTYHVFAIKRVDTGVVDVLFSASPTAPTLPASYTLFRRIGSIVRAAASILAFSQNGDEFLLDEPVLDIDATGQGTTAILRTLASAPTGIKVDAMIRTRATNTSGWFLIISSPDVSDMAPSITVSPLSDLGANAGVADRATLRVRTNASAQVRSRSSQAGTDLQIATYGWVDTRGK
jgi:hypothetical protein